MLGKQRYFEDILFGRHGLPQEKVGNEGISVTRAKLIKSKIN